jgi:pilus assembly protein TadC
MYGLGPSELVFIFILGPLWLWALVDCVRKESLGRNERLTWVLVIVFLGPLGALLYFANRWLKRARASAR